MSKHKYAEMIKAKVDNMELVVFCYSPSKDEFRELPNNYLPDTSASSYFLCLPQHKEVCLHWLNGGSCLIYFESVKDTFGVIHGKSPKEWTFDCGFMNTDAAIRIKPKEETRYIGVKDNGYATKHFATPEEVKRYINRRGFIADLYKITTIEVEV